MAPRRANVRCVRGALLLFALAPIGAHAQQVLNESVQHWALAPFLGTGAYEFDDEQTVYVVEFTPRWTWRESSVPGATPRRPKIEFLVPTTLGLRTFDLGDLEGTLDPDNAATLSVVPGAYVTWPVNERWTLLGTANLGLGARLDGGESAFIHRLGIRSRYSLGDDERRWNLIAAIDRFGFDSSLDREGHMLPLTLAVELELAVDAWATSAGATHLVLHASGAHYLDELSFEAFEDAGAAISNDLEFGVAVRPAEPFRLWKLSWERIGVAYRRGEGDSGTDGDSTFEGIRLYFGSIFDQ